VKRSQQQCHLVLSSLETTDTLVDVPELDPEAKRTSLHHRGGQEDYRQGKNHKGRHG
jgi:hypothetical protein